MFDYSRQRTLFDQRVLKNTRVTIIGAGPIGNYTSCLLAGLGIGSIKILDPETNSYSSSKEYLSKLSMVEAPKAKMLESIVKKINPDIDVRGRVIGPDFTFMGPSDIIVDTTNNPDSKKAMLDILLESGRLHSCKRVISASCDEDEMVIHSYASIIGHLPSKIKKLLADKVAPCFFMDYFKNKQQGGITSGIAAALIVEEIRKAAAPFEYDGEHIHVGYFHRESMTYSPAFPVHMSSRLGTHFKKIDTRTPSGKQKKKALVIGAGGIGTYVALALAIEGVSMDIFDHDIIEDHNLNRQLLYYDAPGKSKALLLESRLTEINPIDIIGINHKFIQNFSDKLDKKHYGVIFSCVDSFGARKMLSDAAKKSGIPLVNGSVSDTRAWMDVYLPGTNSCLDCRHDYSSLAKLDDRRASCASEQANVVMPNVMVGTIMAETGIKILSDNWKTMPFIEKQFEYDALAPARHQLAWAEISTEGKCKNQENTCLSRRGKDNETIYRD